MKKIVTTRSYWMKVTIISFAQILTLIIFSVIVLFLQTSGQLAPSPELESVFMLVVPLATIASLTAAFFIFRMILSKIHPSLPLKEKIAKYLAALMARAALLELPGLLASVAALLTGQLYFLIATLLIVIVFVLVRTTPFTLAEDLSLSGEEKSALQNPDAVLYEV